MTTARLGTRVLFAGPEDADPVLFLHGNLSSATWWEEVMLTLPPGFRGIAPDQRGYGGADPNAKIDATRGTGDLVDDALTLLERLGIEAVHVVGNSMGGSVVWRMLMTAPARLRTVTLVAPGSPYGFGGTRDKLGTLCWDDYAGSGGGLTNPELVRRMAAHDVRLEHAYSPRAVLRALVFKPPFVPVREDEMLEAMLQTHLGAEGYPGDFVKSPNWPYVAPGRWGLLNATSAKYAGDVSTLMTIAPKPPILWIRGSDDLAISDAAAMCAGHLGAQGLIRGWPGADVFPRQPMLGQTRAVLEDYAKAGGSYRELVIENAGHVPFVEDLDGFNVAFHAHLRH